MPLIGSIAALLLRKGLPGWAAKGLSWLAALLAVLAIIGALILGWHLFWQHHDDGVRRDDRQAQTVNALQVQNNRLGTANEADRNLSSGNQNRLDHLQGAIDNAVQAHPQEARRPVGPVTGAALDELRNAP